MGYYYSIIIFITGIKEDWIVTVVVNLIGGCIFFWVDRFIFRSKVVEKWEFLKQSKCHDCGKVDYVRRLVIAPGGYDRTDDLQPEFRCKACSEKKLKSLRQLKRVAI